MIWQGKHVDKQMQITITWVVPSSIFDSVKAVKMKNEEVLTNYLRELGLQDFQMTIMATASSEGDNRVLPFSAAELQGKDFPDMKWESLCHEKANLMTRRTLSFEQKMTGFLVEEYSRDDCWISK